MNKCIGCGVLLQDKEVTKEGYTRNLDSKLCERCFRIKNYNDYKIIDKKNIDFQNIIDNINNSNELVLLITDVFHLNIDKLINSINNPILLVITKRDILPKSMNEDRIINYIKNKNIVDKVLISSIKNYNMDELYEKINTYKKSENVYILGYTNAGKSTLINKILYNYSDNKLSLTTSLLPSTTLDEIKVIVNEELTLIDTPGIINDNDLSSSIDLDMLKKVIPKKEIKPITFQVKKEQYIIIDDIAIIKVKNANLTIYMSNNLNIERIYKEKHISSNKGMLKINKEEDLVIEGVGFIKFSNDTTIDYEIIDNVKIYTRKAL